MSASHTCLPPSVARLSTGLLGCWLHRGDAVRALVRREAGPDPAGAPILVGRGVPPVHQRVEHQVPDEQLEEVVLRFLAFHLEKQR